MRGKTDKYLLAIYLISFAVIAATVALFQPLADTPPLYGNPPDEHARYLVAQYVCEHGVIPTGFEEEIRIPAYGFSYALYNAFPYIVQGYFMRFVDIFTDSDVLLLYAARFVNVLSGLLMAYVVYLLAGILFQDRRFKWLFCCAVMFLPQSLFIHTYVNTDSFCLLSTAMMVYALVGGYREGFTRPNCLWLSGGIILCALSYYNAYGFILSSIFLFTAAFLERKDGKVHYDWKNMLKKGVFISVLVLLGISWWFIRSYLLYDGDMLGLKTRERMAAQYAIEQVNPLTSETYQEKGFTVTEMMEENGFLDSAFLSFVAAYGSMSITGNIWMYRLYKGLFILGIGGYLLCRRWKSLFRRPDWRRLFFHINMVFCMIVPFVLLIHYAYTYDYQSQGRYLLPVIVPFMYYVTAGLEKLAGLKLCPRVLANLGTAACFALIAGGILSMVYGEALPVYLETGLALW